MAYEPTNWKTGDIVTSAKLNKLEQGVQDAGPLIVNIVTVSGGRRLDKTWNQIHDAGLFFLCDDNQNERMYMLGSIYSEEQSGGPVIYKVENLIVGGFTYDTLDPNDYPANTQE